jgi:hypothetical protein
MRISHKMRRLGAAVTGYILHNACAVAAVQPLAFHVSGLAYVRRVSQGPARSVTLHGVVRDVDSVRRRISIVNLPWLEHFWPGTVYYCLVPPGITLATMRRGDHVFATLSRQIDGRYTVVSLMRTQ